MAKTKKFQDGDIISGPQGERGIFSANGLYSIKDTSGDHNDLMTLVSYDSGRPCERYVSAKHVNKVARGNYIDYILEKKFDIERNAGEEISMLSKIFFLGRMISSIRRGKTGKWILENEELMEPQTDTYLLTGYYPGTSSFSSEIVQVHPRLSEKGLGNFLKENYADGIGNIKGKIHGSQLHAYNALCLPHAALPLTKNSIVIPRY